MAAIPAIVDILLSLLLLLSLSSAADLLLPHQHPDPESVVQDLHRVLNVSLSRREILQTSNQSSSKSSPAGCLTGNPIDDCWKCDSDWSSNRERLADCAIGFGRSAKGGKGGQIYTVTDPSDSDPVDPKPGTLRFGVLQEEPLWIIFEKDMTIKLRYELIMTSYKTIDGRGAKVYITGGGCVTLQYVSNIIIHNIHVHHCVPAGNTFIRSSQSHVGYRSKSDGDGITIFGASNIWVDHCTLSYCSDGLIDATMGSTGITVSNSHFSHHNDVMLLGHSDGYVLDAGMQVTLAFNVFGKGLVQRMPRCRRGYIHVVNNDFTSWEIYVIGGSANPTINSQGNRYIAPESTNTKEVTKRVETDDKDWGDWNWRSEGDIMVNGAFFVPSGQGLNAEYTKAWSVEPKSADLIDRLTLNAGVFGDPRDDENAGYGSGTSTSSSSSSSRAGSGSGSGSGSGDDGDFFGMFFGGGNGGNGNSASLALSRPSLMAITLIISILYIITNIDDLSSLTLSSPY